MLALLDDAERADLLIERNHALLAQAEAVQARSRAIVEDTAKRTLRARQMRLSWAQDRFERRRVSVPLYKPPDLP